MYNVQCTLCSAQHIIQCILYNVHCTVYKVHVHSAMYNAQCCNYTAYTVYCAVYNVHVHCSVYNVQRTLKWFGLFVWGSLTDILFIMVYFLHEYTKIWLTIVYIQIVSLNSVLFHFLIILLH